MEINLCVCIHIYIYINFLGKQIYLKGIYRSYILILYIAYLYTYTRRYCYCVVFSFYIYIILYYTLRIDLARYSLKQYIYTRQSYHIYIRVFIRAETVQHSYFARCLLETALRVFDKYIMLHIYIYTIAFYATEIRITYIYIFISKVRFLHLISPSPFGKSRVVSYTSRTMEFVVRALELIAFLTGSLSRARE